MASIWQKPHLSFNHWLIFCKEENSYATRNNGSSKQVPYPHGFYPNAIKYCTNFYIAQNIAYSQQEKNAAKFFKHALKKIFFGIPIGNKAQFKNAFVFFNLPILKSSKD